MVRIFNDWSGWTLDLAFGYYRSFKRFDLMPQSPCKAQGFFFLQAFTAITKRLPIPGTIETMYSHA
jgi:hypothetical protein